MPNEVEQRLREIEEQVRKAKPPYDLIPCDCGDPDCNRAFIGVGADLDANLCGSFRREDAELMTQAPEILRFLLSLLREREEEIRQLREALRPFARAADDPKLHMLVLSHSSPDVFRDDDLRRAKALLEKEGEV